MYGNLKIWLRVLIKVSKVYGIIQVASTIAPPPP